MGILFSTSRSVVDVVDGSENNKSEKINELIGSFGEPENQMGEDSVKNFYSVISLNAKNEGLYIISDIADLLMNKKMINVMFLANTYHLSDIEKSLKRIDELVQQANSNTVKPK